MALVCALLWLAPAHAQVHRAALIIEHSSAWGGPRLLWKCVEFAQESINGLSLLEMGGLNSGQPPQVYDWGGGAVTVCQIDREPRQIPDPCFNKDISRPNWSDWQRTGTGWIPRTTGVTGYSLRDGDVEGWTYSSGFGTPPPSATFAQICPAPAAATVTATIAPRIAPTAAPAAVSAPSASPSTTPTFAALAPTATTGVTSSIARDTSHQEPAGRQSTAPPLLFGSVVILLAGLGAWNFAIRRRR